MNELDFFINNITDETTGLGIRKNEQYMKTEMYIDET